MYVIYNNLFDILYSYEILHLHEGFTFYSGFKNNFSYIYKKPRSDVILVIYSGKSTRSI